MMGLFSEDSKFSNCSCQSSISQGGKNYLKIQQPFPVAAAALVSAQTTKAAGT